MREILYKGVSEKTGEWVFGYFNVESGVPVIHTEDALVIIKRDSLGEYSGVTDRNGVKVFEGDIVQVVRGRYPQVESIDGIVVFRNGQFAIDGPHITLTDKKLEVIGNLFDEMVNGKC